MKQLKAHRINEEISNLYKELKKHQEKCKHLKATKKYGANTGNWDRGSDSYWASLRCPTCLAIWRVDNDHPDYRNKQFETVKEFEERNAAL